MAVELSSRAYAALQAYRLLHGFASLTASSAAPILKHFSRRIATGFNDYLGNVPRAHKPVLWVHGVSMGESMVAAGFAAELKRLYPDYQIAFTTTHPDVFDNVKKRHIADLVAYFPLDNLIAMTRIFDRWKPAAVFVAETDFWPEFSWQCRSRSIPLILINGRISDKIARFYSQFQGLSELVFGAFSLLAVQTETDARRLLEAGARAGQIKVLGNMKADLTAFAASDLKIVKNWVNGRHCIILGSLHPVEFAFLKPAVARLAATRAAVIVAPRNPANSKAWFDELNREGLSVGMRSALSPDVSSDVLILDTMGELAGMYALASAAFVGGSIDDTVGGHNPLEVLQQHVPLIMGPHCRNFADIIEQLRAAEGIIVVTDAEEFLHAADGLLQNQELAQKQVRAADEILDLNRGCLSRTLEVALVVANLKGLKQG